MFRDRQAQERRDLSALLRHFGMDASLVNGRPTLASDGNWAAELLRQVAAVIPPPAFMIYCDTEPTDQDIGLFVQGDAEARANAHVEDGLIRTYDMAKLRRGVMKPWRNRGKVPSLLVGSARQLIAEPLQHVIGFAVPSDDALEILSGHGPLIEVGAGTGYWSAMLRHRRVDVVTYDSHPPSSELTNGFFYDVAFTEVLKGDGATLFAERPELARRALLLVWPNNPDQVDNPELDADGAKGVEHVVWDADCLETYIAAGGKKVVYVGERESEIKVIAGAPPDSGITGSRRFQAMLRKHFKLEQQVAIPRWPTAADDLTVWRRRTSLTT